LRGHRPGPNGGVADSLDEAKAAFRAGMGAAPLIGGGTPAEAGQRLLSLEQSGREMLNLSLSAHDPGRVKTLAR
jgi:hypothetical protein